MCFVFYFNFQSLWAVSLVQLIALLYKDQHATTLHKLLNVWVETSLSDSSEDNESNTTPPNTSIVIFYHIIKIRKQVLCQSKEFMKLQGVKIRRLC